MTDHKFTDDEIIHSLKVCSNDGDCSECLINPHKGNYGYCTSLAIKAALDLINRQKVKIEGLESNLKFVRGTNRRLIENESVVRAEAIKEFAERLKSDLGRIPQHQFTRSQVEWSINTFVKEMTEENK
jgi:hypothetical protein